MTVSSAASAVPVVAAYTPDISSGRFKVINFDKAQQITLGGFWTQVYNNIRAKDVKNCDVVQLTKADGEKIDDVRAEEKKNDWFGLHSLGVAVSLYVKTLVESKVMPIINKLREVRKSIPDSFGGVKERIKKEMDFTADIRAGSEQLDRDLDPEGDLLGELNKVGPIRPVATA